MPSSPYPFATPLAVDNAAVVLVDHQNGLFQFLPSIGASKLRNGILAPAECDADYWLRRAAEQRRCADRAASPQAARAHRSLARLYDERGAREAGCPLVSPANSSMTAGSRMTHASHHLRAGSET